MISFARKIILFLENNIIYFEKHTKPYTGLTYAFLTTFFFCFQAYLVKVLKAPSFQIVQTRATFIYVFAYTTLKLSN